MKRDHLKTLDWKSSKKIRGKSRKRLIAWLRDIQKMRIRGDLTVNKRLKLSSKQLDLEINTQE